MKKLIFTLAVIFCSLGAFAQFEKGTILAGGSFEFSGEKNKIKTDNSTTTYAKTTSISLAPQAGYFIIDNLAIGAALDLGTQVKKSETSDYKVTSSQIQLAPFARYYFEPGIFIHGQVGFGSGNDKVKQGNTTTDNKTGLFSYNAGVGYALFLNDNVAIEPMFGYRYLSIKDKESNPKTKDIASGAFLRVGFQIYLR